MHPVKFLSRGRGGGLWWPAGLLFKTLCADIDIWVAFGVGKYFMYSHINYIFYMLGEDKCLPLPVFHSFTGCDTRLHQLSFVVVKKWHDQHGIVIRRN